MFKNDVFIHQNILIHLTVSVLVDILVVIFFLVVQAPNATCNTEILNLNFKRYLNIFFISSQFTSFILLNALNFVDLSTPLSIKHTNTLTHTHTFVLAEAFIRVSP